MRRLAAKGLKGPQSVTLSITNRCNLSCRHCWPDSGPGANAPVVPKEQVLTVMAGFAALGAEKIVITGGEPLTHPDWEEMLIFASRQPTISEIRLQTNAILMTPAHVASLVALQDQGLMIQISLEGATAPVHDRVRGTGSFAQTLQGLQLLIDSGLAPQICITFTEMQHNIGQLPDLLMMAYEKGIGQFVSGTLVRGGRALQPGDLAPPRPHQYEKLLERYQNNKPFRDRYHQIGTIAAIEWSKGASDVAETCCSFIETPYVTPEGFLFPCVLLHAKDYAATDVYHRPLAASISEVIDRWYRLKQIKEARLTQVKACQHCHHYLRCGAGCLGRAHAMQGDLMAKEDRCDLKKAVYAWVAHR
jgi:radical SAM protein with 4Fe4S-binding SPASM domain